MGEAGRSRDAEGRGGTVGKSTKQNLPETGSLFPELEPQVAEPVAELEPACASEPDDSESGRYAQVIVDMKVRSQDETGPGRTFTYSIPARLADDVHVGSYVLVPFGKQRLPGWVIGFSAEKPTFKLRDITSLLLDTPVFSEQEASLAAWIADRYICPPADALRLLLPPGGSRKVLRELVATETGQQACCQGLLDRAGRQKMVMEALLDGPREFDELCTALVRNDRGLKRNSVSSAVESLCGRGYVEQARRLQRPAASTVTRQTAYLSQGDHDWAAICEELSTKAPRQVEVIEELMAAEDAGVAVAELNRGAVTALRSKGLVVVADEVVRRAPECESWGDASSEFLDLTDDQRHVYESILEPLEQGVFKEMLLQGVTGSGKTEIYLYAISKTLSLGKTAIVLVPEIALTPQMVGRFRARFGDRLALMHSALGTGERFDEWQRAASGEARIVIGARSAIFAPLQNIGIVIIDEEYDSAYKQDSSPRYDAIEVARKRAKMSGAVLVMGSATPSIERYYAAITGQGAELLELKHRIDDRPMPEVKIVDLRREVKTGTGATFSEELLEALTRRLEDREQSMLFLNRRGFSTFMICRACGFTPRCPECSVSLTHHYGEDVLKCHHCDYRTKVPEKCPDCGDLDIGFLGLGTEKVADQVQRAFPNARVLRMDRDTITTKGAYGNILGKFARGEADILVGTQMIATGHDFPNVTLVGVLNADTGLHRSDFRAAETTFQLLTQVAGRPGRAQKLGQVLVQTYNADHYAVRTAAQHDYLAFYARERVARENSLWPPFVRLLRLVISSEDQQQGMATAQELAVALQRAGVYHKGLDASADASADWAEKMHYIGPAECALKKLRGRFRFNVLLKGPDADSLAQAVRETLATFRVPDNVNVVADVDPLNMM